ncbi:hypothetical protein [Streptomyces sp. NPDC051776]|uniref:hypothetical protein n=1 Tax=Streptomyces sp. NPDC051776 TaxID=3155414 RepID=UPI003424BFBD
MHVMRIVPLSVCVSAAALLLASAPALAIGGGGTKGGSDGKGNIAASATQSRIVVKQKSGATDGEKGNLAPVDTNWEPPVCWYEPVFSPGQLKAFVDKTDGHGDVGIHESWYGKGLWTDHYKDGKASSNLDDEWSKAPGYKNYNIGKDGYFWRSVAPDDSHPDSWDCGRIMFWQNAGEVPDVPHAPTPKTLAGYAYDKIRVPDTEVELNPETKSTVNLPTWVWLDKGTFKNVKVRAELPNTGLWAETTAKPVSLNLDPGTEDAKLHPASGQCKINDDGSIGTPYTKGKAKEAPPCGITYLRASDEPYKLNASVTWEISWEGSGGASGDLPDGTFETDKDMTVQEVQAINR